MKTEQWGKPCGIYNQHKEWKQCRKIQKWKFTRSQQESSSISLRHVFAQSASSKYIQTMKASDLRLTVLVHRVHCSEFLKPTWNTLTEQRAAWHGQQFTSGPWCHHLTPVQMSAYLWLRVDYCSRPAGVSGCFPIISAVAQGHSRITTQCGEANGTKNGSNSGSNVK